jgi:Flp pilus assembly protein TadB
MTLWLVLAAVVILGLLAYVARGGIGFGASSDVAVRQSIRDMVAAQREETTADDRRNFTYTTNSRSEDDPEGGQGGASSDNRLSLQKRLKYGQLSHIPQFVFAVAQIVISVAAFLLARQYFYILIQLMALTTGPLIVNAYINHRVNARFKRFDRDFPQFLLSFVGMLKTGLNPMQALEACAVNLEDTSLVRQEVELMLERLRLGVSEERSIGSFGEDVNHAEIELFVQTLLLSRRVGGNLSETIDRLARQVRKRQYFRASAQAAVGLQRGSILFILGILFSLEVYLYLAWPECVIITWTDPTAAKVAQGGLTMIMIGMYWVLQVTKIRV